MYMYIYIYIYTYIHTYIINEALPRSAEHGKRLPRGEIIITVSVSYYPFTSIILLLVLYVLSLLSVLIIILLLVLYV